MDEESVIRLRNAIMRTGRRLRTTASDEGLTATQSSVLATLVRQGPTGAGELAAAEAVNPTMLSRVLAHLEEAGLVRREQASNDARCTVARATADGRRLVTRLRVRRAALLMARIEELDQAHVAQLVQALPALEALAGIDGEAR